MIIFLYGADSYRARQRLRFYRDGFKKKYDPSGLNVVRLDGEKLAMENFRKAVGSAGFLAKKRFITIENLISRNKNKKIQSDIVEYLDSEWSDDNVVVFIEEAAPVRRGKRPGSSAHPLADRLAKEHAEEFPVLSGEQLHAWIRTETKGRKGFIETPAVLALASLVGSDLWTMSSEIDKLISLKSGEPITADDVRTTVRASFDENIFHLTDALAERDAKRSYALLHDQLQSGNHPLYILTMLVRQFRILLQVREIIDQESNYYTVASRLKLHPFVAQKAIRDARKFTLADLKNSYQRLLELDIALKSSPHDPRVMFDLLITQVCRAA
ncbi:MAG: DNA polymerase III subunit delta [Patescibacteria group bacterium]